MPPDFKPRYIIEAEKAGAKAERERLAKVAEEDRWYLASPRDAQDGEPLADWIRAQGEEQ